MFMSPYKRDSLGIDSPRQFPLVRTGTVYNAKQRSNPPGRIVPCLAGVEQGTTQQTKQQIRRMQTMDMARVMKILQQDMPTKPDINIAPLYPDVQVVSDSSSAKTKSKTDKLADKIWYRVTELRTKENPSYEPFSLLQVSESRELSLTSESKRDLTSSGSVRHIATPTAGTPRRINPEAFT